MKKVGIILCLSLTLALLLAARSPESRHAQTITPRYLPLTDLLRSTTLTNDYWVAGQVEDVILDLETAHADFVVVRSSQLIEADSRHIPMPWSVMEIEAAEDLFILYADANRKQFQTRLPSVALDAFPVLNQPGWDGLIYRIWDETIPANVVPPVPGIEESLAPLPASILASSALDMDIHAKNGLVIGAIQDIFIDLETGNLRYILLKTAKGPEDLRLIPIPIRSLEFDIFRRTLSIPFTQKELAKAPTLAPTAPRTLTSTTAEAADRFFAKRPALFGELFDVISR